LGTPESLETITLADLKDYYKNNLSPMRAKFIAVGDLDEKMAKESLRAISANWKPVSVKMPKLTIPTPPEKSVVYFYDVPGAKQSVIKIGAPALPATSEDFYKAEVMNYRLGGGGFASQLTQELREGKGYTYGIRSRFNGSNLVGPFEISSGVRSNITYDAVALIKKILINYSESLDPTDVDVTQSFMIKSNARKLETLNAKLSMLSDIANFNYPDDFIKQQEIVVKDMSLEDFKALAGKYVNPFKMYYLIVGDAATQLEKLEQLEFGKPILINEK
jgi:zinc protease